MIKSHKGCDRLLVSIHWVSSSPFTRLDLFKRNSIRNHRQGKTLKYFSLLPTLLFLFSFTAFAGDKSENLYSKTCYLENKSAVPGLSAHWQRLCSDIHSQFELMCVRFTDQTRDWNSACPGINTADRLECASIVMNAPGYASKETIGECRKINSAEELNCISQKRSGAIFPLRPDDVANCIQKKK